MGILMSRRTLAVFSAVVILATSVVAAAGPASSAPGAGRSAVGRSIQRLTTVKAMYDVGTRPPATGTRSASATGGLKVWSTTVHDGTSSFTYRMVGKNPFVAQAAPSTTVKTPVIPVIIKFTDGSTWNPTVGDSCDATSAVTRTLNSPVVKPTTWSFGGTAVGTGQYSDVFQRASFFPQTTTGGLNPGYHVKLAYTLRPAITINVPTASSAHGTISCGNKLLGAVDINFLDNYIRTIALPQLATAGFGPTTFPLFLLDNVVEYIGTPGQCCVLGFHSATSTAPGAQTYSIAMYDNTHGAFGATTSDVSVVSHEVSEWVNDPFGNNPTKPWGNIGQVTGCQSNLEVGDPLSGTSFTVPFGGFTYRLQELAFVSWFYHQNPSTGVNGWYSSGGTFRSAAGSCP